jgi:DNA-binding IclR family transcriptional regulator
VSAYQTPTDPDVGDGGDLQVVSRCGQILRLFTPARRTLRTAEVAELLGLQRTTVHRYVASMVRTGLLSRGEDGSYGIGPLPLQLTTVALGGRQVMEEATTFMTRLADTSHQTVVLSVWGGLEPVVVKVCEDMTTPVNVSVRVGTALPLDSAQSHLFLGLLHNRNEVERLLGRLPAALAEEMRMTATQAADVHLAINSQFVQGVRAVAAPVFSAEGLVATMAVVGTTSAIPDDPGSPVAQALQNAAQELSERIGGGAYWTQRRAS